MAAAAHTTHQSRINRPAGLRSFRGTNTSTGGVTNSVALHFIEPGKPAQNAFIESFNGRLCENV